MKKRFNFSILTLISVLGLSGCTLMPVEFSSSQDTLIPSQWSQDSSVDEAFALEPPQKWWARWNDTSLSALIQATLNSNTDIAIAQANLRASQASVLSADAALWPSASIGADVVRRRSGGDWTKSYGADASATWSLSFGGRDLAARRAAVASAQAQSLLLEDTKNAMTAEVATAYIKLCLAFKKREIAKQNLVSYEEAKNLTQWRYQAGLVHASDFEQAVAQYESALASLAANEHAIFEYQTALSRLTLLPLKTIQSMASDSIPTPPEYLALMLPARLLELRPDVLAAKQSVIASMENVRVAQASYYPSLSLSGSIGTAAASVGALGVSGTGVGALAAALSMPILNWGDTVAETERQKANVDKALAQYRLALIGALQETENALSALKTSKRKKSSLAQATQSSHVAASLALHQYSSGLTDYQTVLSTQRSHLAAQESEVNNMADWAIAHIDLYRTLGGGWTPQTITTGENYEKN